MSLFAHILHDPVVGISSFFYLSRSASNIKQKMGGREQIRKAEDEYIHI